MGKKSNLYSEFYSNEKILNSKRSNSHSEFYSNKKILNSKRSNSHSEFYSNEKILNSKRSQSNIIVSVLLILIILVAVAIIWIVVRGLVKDKSEDIDFTPVLLGANIQEFRLLNNFTAEVRLQRSSSVGNVTGIKLVFEDSNNKIYYYSNNSALDILESRTYFVENDSLEPPLVDFKDITRVSVYFAYKGSDGKEKITAQLDTRSSSFSTESSQTEYTCTPVWSNTNEFKCSGNVREVKQNNTCNSDTRWNSTVGNCQLGYVCYNGINHPSDLCINASQQCLDSDRGTNGIDYGTRGYVNKTNGIIWQETYDMCVGTSNNVSDFYCYYNNQTNKTEIKNQTFDCVYSCNLGACEGCVNTDGDIYNDTGGIICGPMDCATNVASCNVDCASLFYFDKDGDSFGNASVSHRGCDSSSNYVNNNTDCNDNNSSIKPGAFELCGNNVDDDCDGLIDEGFLFLPNPCYDGMGECRRAGTMVCSLSRLTTECNAIAGTTRTEDCNDVGLLDEDCDGYSNDADPDCVVSDCGNGIIEPGEDCDDNNIKNGEGCSSVCSVESGYGCVGEPSVCSAISLECTDAKTLCVDDTPGEFQEYSTIQAAVNVAIPGDTILVKGGIYNEAVNIIRSGTAGNPITIKNYPGETPILDGTEPVTGWELCFANEPGLTVEGVTNVNTASIYKSKILGSRLPADKDDWAIFENLEKDRIARWPDQTLGYGFDESELQVVSSESFGYKDRLIDNTHLSSANPSGFFYNYIKNLDSSQLSSYWDNSMISVWLKYNSNSISKKSVSSYLDNSLYVSSNFSRALQSGDAYSIYRHPHALDSPGEFYFSSEPDAQGYYTFYLWPKDVGSLSEDITIPLKTRGFYANTKNYITIEGFKVLGYLGEGIFFYSSGSSYKNDNITIKNTIVEDCGDVGIYLQQSSGSLVQGCNVSRVSNRGIFINGGSNVKIDSCSASDVLGTGISFYNVKYGQIINNNIYGPRGIHSNGVSVYLDSEKILIARNKFHIDTDINLALQSIKDVVVFANIFDAQHKLSNFVKTNPDTSNSDFPTQGYQVYAQNTIIRGAIPQHTVIDFLSALRRFSDATIDNDNGKVRINAVGVFNTTYIAVKGVGATYGSMVFCNFSTNNYADGWYETIGRTDTSLTIDLAYSTSVPLVSGQVEGESQNYLFNNLIGGSSSWDENVVDRKYNGWIPTAYSGQGSSDGWDINDASNEGSWQFSRIGIESRSKGDGESYYDVFKNLDNFDYGLTVPTGGIDNPAIHSGRNIQQILTDMGIKDEFPDFDFTKDIEGNSWGNPPSMGAYEYDGIECYLASNCLDKECQDKFCTGNQCVYTNNNGLTCGDGLFCNGVETCQSGSCVSGTQPCSLTQTCSEPGTCNNAVFPTDYIGYWKLDDNVGTNAIDSSVNGNTGLLSGNPIWTSGGKINSALSFDGNGDYLDIPHNENQLLTNGGTISVWIYPLNLGELNLGRIIDKSAGISSQYGFTLYLRSANTFTFGIAEAPGVISSDNAIVLNEWNHIVVTFDNLGNVKLYKSGVEIGSGTTKSPSSITTTNPLRLGGVSTISTRDFNGIMDEVMIYNRPLNSAEVKVIYNEQSGGSVGSQSLLSSMIEFFKNLF